MSMMSTANAIKLLREGAKAVNLTVNDYANAVTDYIDRTATERSDHETREAAKPLIRALFDHDPAANLEPREIVGRVGLKNCQADRAFAGYQWKQARLAYQPHKAAAD